jgi:chorismate-pyruvate lyase
MSQPQMEFCGDECLTAESLVGIYYEESRDLATFQYVPAVEVPQPYRDLLAHENHMTVTVEGFHRDTVDVEVLRDEFQGSVYHREILLRTHHTGVVVQYGIVRLFPRFLPEQPLQEILARQKPLGRVLIEHDVLRHIELFDLLQIRCGKVLADFFSVPIGTKTYGRTAILHCNNEPAIELLEIVRP